jgi:hypothetical protein
LIETLAESLGFLSRAGYELLIDREGDVHRHSTCGHVLCVNPLSESCQFRLSVPNGSVAFLLDIASQLLK